MKAVLALYALCVLDAFISGALAGPAFYVQPNAKSCVEPPQKALGGQGAAQTDRFDVGHLSAPVRKWPHLHVIEQLTVILCMQCNLYCGNIANCGSLSGSMPWR